VAVQVKKTELDQEVKNKHGAGKEKQPGGARYMGFPRKHTKGCKPSEKSKKNRKKQNPLETSRGGGNDYCGTHAFKKAEGGRVRRGVFKFVTREPMGKETFEDNASYCRRWGRRDETGPAPSVLHQPQKKVQVHAKKDVMDVTRGNQ